MSGQLARTGDQTLALGTASAVEITSEIQPTVLWPRIRVVHGDRMQSDAVVDPSQAISILDEIGGAAEGGMAAENLEGDWPEEIVRRRGTMDSQTGTTIRVARV